MNPIKKVWKILKELFRKVNPNTKSELIEE